MQSLQTMHNFCEPCTTTASRAHLLRTMRSKIRFHKEFNLFAMDSDRTLVTMTVDAHLKSTEQYSGACHSPRVNGSSPEDLLIKLPRKHWTTPRLLLSQDESALKELFVFFTLCCFFFPYPAVKTHLQNIHMGPHYRCLKSLFPNLVFTPHSLQSNQTKICSYNF